jgi:hypothetical protein
MKKIIVMISLFLCLSFSLVFAQDFEYTGFVKTVIDQDGYAIINDMTYQPGEMIKGTNYRLLQIEYDYVILQNVEDNSTIKIGFKNSKLKN